MQATKPTTLVEQLIEAAGTDAEALDAMHVAAYDCLTLSQRAAHFDAAGLRDIFTDGEARGRPDSEVLFVAAFRLLTPAQRAVFFADERVDELMSDDDYAEVDESAP